MAHRSTQEPRSITELGATIEARWKKEDVVLYGETNSGANLGQIRNGFVDEFKAAFSNLIAERVIRFGMVGSSHTHFEASFPTNPMITYRVEGPLVFNNGKTITATEWIKSSTPAGAELEMFKRMNAAVDELTTTVGPWTLTVEQYHYL